MKLRAKRHPYLLPRSILLFPAGSATCTRDQAAATGHGGETLAPSRLAAACCTLTQTCGVCWRVLRREERWLAWQAGGACTRLPACHWRASLLTFPFSGQTFSYPLSAGARGMPRGAAAARPSLEGRKRRGGWRLAGAAAATPALCAAGRPEGEAGWAARRRQAA